MVKLYLAIGAFAIVAVVVIALVLSVLNQNEGPEDVLKAIVKSWNKGDGRGVTDHTVHFFSPSADYEMKVNATQQKLDDYHIDLSNLTVIGVLYFAEMNQSMKDLVTDFSIEYQTHLCPSVDFEADDY